MAGIFDTRLLFTKSVGWLYVKMVGEDARAARVASFRFWA
jgi:hypothetical protein